MKMKKEPILIVFCFVIIPLVTVLLFGDENSESDRIASKYNAVREHVLWDKTRVDLLNDEYAIEVDWSKKWAEAIGQSLYYAEVTHRKPGIVLLVKSLPEERRFIYRCQTVCAKYDIRLWVEKVNP